MQPHLFRKRSNIFKYQKNLEKIDWDDYDPNWQDSWGKEGDKKHGSKAEKDNG